MRLRPSAKMVCTGASCVWLLFTLLACGHGYESGSLETTANETSGESSETVAGESSETVATGCLEVRATSHSDERLRELGWVGVRYELGNSCDGAVPVDLSHAVVVATPAAAPRSTRTDLPAPEFYSEDVGNTPILLAAWDPQEQIRAALLDGRRTAHEVIAYVVPPGLGPLDVCVEVEPVLHQPAEPVCFRWSGS